MNLTYKTGIIPEKVLVVELYKSAGLNRPVEDVDRIARMYANSNLVITAWDGQTLVGVARSLTDFCYCCYLSDLAVRKEYQKLGIGKKLIHLTKEEIGDQTMLLLLSAPAAMEYYPIVGFQKVNNAFMINRVK